MASNNLNKNAEYMKKKWEKEGNVLFSMENCYKIHEPAVDLNRAERISRVLLKNIVRFFVTLIQK